MRDSPAGGLSGYFALDADHLAALKPRPRLIMMPFDFRHDKATAGGTATTALSGNLVSNPDRTQTGLTVTVPADAGWASYAVIRSTRQGSAIGVRLDRSIGSLNLATPWGVYVDRQPIEVDWSQNVQLSTQTANQDNGNVRNILLGTDFGDGDHEVIIIIPGGTAQQVVTFHGWLADAAAGYREPAQGYDIQAAQITTPAGSPYLVGPNSGINQAFVGFYYVNLTASPMTVSVLGATTTAVQPNPLITFSVAAGANGYHALPGPVYDGFQVLSSAALTITPVSLMQ
ncbi:hypothetical protein [Sphingomonas sp. MMS24-J13]|uniref:hypothetical protein n=1 Tax=Sphingomonas sp. MMS24-J13 TaxID=3238686 RepID=UPI00384C4595